MLDFSLNSKAKLLTITVAQMVKNLPAMQETRVQFLGWEVPLEKGMAIHSNILAWKFHGQRNLMGYSPWTLKELDMTEQLTHTHREGRALLRQNIRDHIFPIL